MEMNKECVFCGQTTEIEEGFCYGTDYAGYALTIALSASTFVTCWLLIEIFRQHNCVFWCQGMNAGLMMLLQPIVIIMTRIQIRKSYLCKIYLLAINSKK